jgi:hypothetical protein
VETCLPFEEADEQPVEHQRAIATVTCVDSGGPPRQSRAWWFAIRRGRLRALDWAAMSRMLSFGPVKVRRLPIRGVSAVAAIPGALLVVEDDEGIFRVARGRAALWAGRDDHPALGDLEGIATDETHRTVWALAEEDGAVIALPFGGRSRRSTLVGHLPRPGTRKNKGFEGLAYMPARLSPSRRASLVVVNEAKPRRVQLFALPALALTHDLKLPGRIKDLLQDLADVTVDPVTGALLLLSDQSQRIVVARIVDQKLSLLGSYDLPLSRGEKPEGLDFSSPSRLLVVMDDSAKLLEISVRRRAGR